MSEEELQEYLKLNNIERKDITGRQKIENVYTNYGNYLIILVMIIVQIVISVLTAVDGNIRNAFPTTEMEWIIWSVLNIVKGAVAFIIFDAFVKEGVRRGKGSENYKMAEKRFYELFNKEISKDVKTQSPKEYLAKTRGKKSVSLVLSALLSGIGVSLASINFDWTNLIGTCLTIVMMIVWGYQKMLQVEEYFNNGYVEYVIVLEHKIKISKEEKQNGN